MWIGGSRRADRKLMDGLYWSRLWRRHGFWAKQWSCLSAEGGYADGLMGLPQSYSVEWRLEGFPQRRESGFWFGAQRIG